MSGFGNKIDPKAPLPAPAREALAAAVTRLEEEKRQIADRHKHTQTTSGKRYYEGMQRGIETALILLAGEAENARQKNVKGEYDDDDE